MGLLGKKSETVPKSTYDTLQAERNTLEREVTRLQAQVADLTGKYSALGFDGAPVRGLTKEAIALLLGVDTRRTGGMSLQKRIDDIVARAGHLGLVPEKERED